MRIPYRLWAPAVGLAVLAGVWSVGVVTRALDHELPVLWAAPEFLLTDQSDQAFSSAELTGQVWVAGFIFTQCTDICPLITSRMAILRDSLAAKGLLGESVRLVSFSVDPARDTPEVLADYARRFGASPSSEWAFLTGPDPGSIRSMIQEGFHVTAVAAAGHGGHAYEVMHSPRVMIVDAEGVVRGHYDSRRPEFVQLVLGDLRTLLRN